MALAAAVLGLDPNGNPRTLRLLAALVEAESRHFAHAAASRPAAAQSNLVRAFRGGATPAVPIAEFLGRVQRCNPLFEGGVYVLAGAYIARFVRSRAAREAGILLEPATAHRLVSVAVLLGAKFCSSRREKRVASFQICSGQAIRASEMSSLELRFLRAIYFDVAIEDEEFRRFLGVMERGPKVPGASSGSSKKRKAEAEASSSGSRKRKADADAVAGREEEEPRGVRPCQLQALASKFGFLPSCHSIRSLH